MYWYACPLSLSFSLSLFFLFLLLFCFCRTRNHFLDSFDDATATMVPSNRLSHIRFFVDGMHQYIMDHHAKDQQNSELGRLLVTVSFTDDHVDKRSNTSMVLEARSSG